MKNNQLYNAHEIGLPTVKGSYWCLCESTKWKLVLLQGRFDGKEFRFSVPIFQVKYWFTEK